MSKLHLTLIALFAFLISIPVLLPLFRSEFFHLHDFTHVARLHEMDAALKAGHFPVRWSKNLGFGYGLPQFNFYAPLPYYIAQVFHLLGFTYLASIKLLIIANIVVGFVALYYAASQFFGKWAGLLSATAFIYAPYRAVDIYVRGALAELTGITFMGIALAAITHWYKKRTLQSSIWVGLSLAGIVASHNLMGLMGVPALLFFWVLLLLFALKDKWKIYLPHILIGALVAMGASAFYAFPALLEKDFTRVGTLTSGFSNYAHHFVYLRQFIHSPWGYGGSIWGIDDDISFEIGKVHILLGILAGIAFASQFKKIRNSRKAVLIGSGSIILISIFMANHKSKFIWDTLPLIDFIQFPWRFLSLILVFAALLSGASVLLFKRGWQKMVWVLVFIFLLMGMNTRFFKPEKYLENNDSLYYENEQRIQKEMSGIIPDFMPLYDSELPLEVPDKRFAFSDGAEGLQVLVDRPHEFLLRFLPEEEKVVVANIAYFPGWNLYQDGKEIPFTVDNKTGAMSVVVEEGVEAIEISGRFTETPLRKAANAITAITLIGSGYILFIHEKDGNKA